MKNGDYIKAKNDIDNGVSITRQTLNEMKDMKKEFDNYITKLTVMGDIKQAMFMKKTSWEIGHYIECAIVA